jgi:predicted ATPase
MPDRQHIFSVVSPRRTAPSGTDLSPFVLAQDNWDDFGFKTQYQLYVSRGSGKYELIGSVKIATRDQKEGDGPRITSSFTQLDSSHLSLGQSLDYYQRVGELPVELRDKILVGLQDAVNLPERESEFDREPAWEKSVLRDFQNDPHFRILAKSLLSGNFSQLAEISEGFSFQVPHWTAPLEFKFRAPATMVPTFFGTPSQIAPLALPDRLTVIVGRNASGKSTLLARLARVAHAATRDRSLSAVASLGRLVPAGVGFPRVITVSYSAFDSFEIPGVNSQERAQIARDVEKGEGRFVFCGLRDIAAELAAGRDDSDRGDRQQRPNEVVSDRVRSTLLKPIEKLADEFQATIQRIDSLNRRSLLESTLSTVLKEASFNDLRTDLLSRVTANGSREAFLEWSTGHKLVLHTIASLIAYTEPRSLVLFDEPELHLHPPLLAALMHAVRQILRVQDAFGVVATHSPVVLQETLSEHVYVVRREGGTTDVSSPAIQSFGEGVGTLTEFVFGLNAEATDFHTLLRWLAAYRGTTDSIEQVFQPQGLSMQARAFLMSLIARTREGGNVEP